MPLSSVSQPPYVGVVASALSGPVPCDLVQAVLVASATASAGLASVVVVAKASGMSSDAIVVAVVDATSDSESSVHMVDIPAWSFLNIDAWR